MNAAVAFSAQENMTKAYFRAAKVEMFAKKYSSLDEMRTSDSWEEYAVRCSAADKRPVSRLDWESYYLYRCACGFKT